MSANRINLALLAAYVPDLLRICGVARRAATAMDSSSNSALITISALELRPYEFFTRKRDRFSSGKPGLRMLEGRTPLFSHRLQIFSQRDSARRTDLCLRNDEAILTTR